YVVIVAPVLGWAQSGFQLVADRYSYLSCLGFSMLAAGGLLWCAGRGMRVIAAVAACAVVLTLSVATFRFTGSWPRSRTLWARAVRVDPGSWVSRSNYADALAAAGDVNAALEQYAAAVRLNPTAGTAWLGYGVVLVNEHRYPEAEAALREAARYHVVPARAE